MKAGHVRVNDVAPEWYAEADVYEALVNSTLKWSPEGLRVPPGLQCLNEADARVSKLCSENERRRKKGMPPIRPQVRA